MWFPSLKFPAREDVSDSVSWFGVVRRVRKEEAVLDATAAAMSQQQHVVGWRLVYLTCQGGEGLGW